MHVIAKLYNLSDKQLILHIAPDSVILPSVPQSSGQIGFSKSILERPLIFEA